MRKRNRGRVNTTREHEKQMRCACMGGKEAGRVAGRLIPRPPATPAAGTSPRMGTAIVSALRAGPISDRVEKPWALRAENNESM